LNCSLIEFQKEDTLKSKSHQPKYFLPVRLLRQIEYIWYIWDGQFLSIRRVVSRSFQPELGVFGDL
jgi:hypothetical protein